ncbi:aminotransferase class V-fold PLP-dependent enzyme [Microscilla marina]|uniref:phosphoserine transaminase n=1 Tax=Microscilla marina ATCC 23134 TaxID=313606 RepID=A1ZFV9_MICM2|nr:aminotransferase class V-fold PLP-dependent enzyme [Microscilla marina]EAY30883.1 aminotransferase, class V superfamily [Microscilla marina ATCC 23134]
MNKQTFFTPGPAALYPTVAQHIQSALDKQIPSISHRSKVFQDIYKQTYHNIRTIFKLPDDYAVLFTGSATEVWERMLQNCVETESFHLVNGAFSKRFADFAQLMGKTAHLHEVPFGEGFDMAKVDIPSTAEMICVAHNETSAGVSTPVDDIHALKDQHPDKLLVVDMVSSAPLPLLDFNKIDAAYFSVQKAFGMPAGLGVWLVNKRCLDKAKKLEAKGQATGAHYRLVNLWKSFEKFQTPPTPNVLGIYLLGKVSEDMLNQGIDQIRHETEVKANLLYNALSNPTIFKGFSPFVANHQHRSASVIVANTPGSAAEFIAKVGQHHMTIGSGYGKYKDAQIRIANFPATSVAQIEQLIETMTQCL